MALANGPRAGSAKSCTPTRSGSPVGAHSAPPLANSPINSPGSPGVLLRPGPPQNRTYTLPRIRLKQAQRLVDMAVSLPSRRLEASATSGVYETKCAVIARASPLLVE